MEAVVFDFREEHSRMFGKVKRPVADVEISKGQNKLTMSFYVDSGADLTLIPKSLGDSLGLESDASDIKEVQGVGARQIPVVLRKVNLKIGKKELEAEVAWSLIEEVPLLLGRKDIFDNFEISFKDNKTTFRY